ncbi:MAG: hypothetical protein ABI580_08055 [Burkholderiaceae bacterium]
MISIDQIRRLTVPLAAASANGDHIPDLMARYFAAGDDGTVVWWMTYAAPVRPHTPFLDGSLDIKDEAGAVISIADVFDGREPQRVDAHAARGGEATIPFRVELMLDSQLVSYMHQYVARSPRLSEQHRALVTRLLRFAVKKRIGYNPAFYFLEALRNPDGREREFARATAGSILDLHTMDDRHFLATGEIRPSPEIQEIYRRDYGCETNEATVEAYTNGFVGPKVSPSLADSGRGRVRYATLLGIADIHRRRPGTNWPDIKKKCEAFDDMLGEVGAEMGLERLVAVRHFAGQLDDFLPVQKGARIDRVLSRLKAAVWDLELLSMPAIRLAQPPEFGVVVAYPCTADRSLGELAKSFTIELVVALSDDRYPLPVYGLRDRILQQALAIRGRGRPWTRTRRLQEAELDALVYEREQQTIAHCR